jgi:PAS domain S-box-containing protein
MKILIVEDDRSIAEVLTTILTDQNYVVETVSDGQAGWDLVDVFQYDLLLLDVKLPKLDGISLCRRIRAKNLSTPIMLLTACDSSHEKALGLDAGADDYMVKPFAAEELVARIRALLRRGSNNTQPILTLGKLRLDPSSCEVSYDDRALILTPKEFSLLELLLRNSRRVFSCGTILEHLWSYEATPGEEAVRTHVKCLRQKLKAVGAPGDLIETVYGIGYRLKLTPTKQPSHHQAGKGNHNGQHKKASQPQVTNSNKREIDRAIAKIWSQFKERVSQQVKVLEQAAAALNNNDYTDELKLNAIKDAHSLAGALGSFGFPHGSQLARQIEQLLQTESLLTAQETRYLTELVSSLCQEIELEPNLDSQKTATKSEKPLLLLVDRDLDLVQQLDRQASRSGWQTEIVTNLDTARTIVERKQPKVVLLEPNTSPHLEDSLQFLSELNQRTPPIPILVFTEQTHLDNRLQMSKVGTHSFLSKSMPIERVFETVERVSQPTNLTEATVLAVDDDPKILALLTSLLEPWGINVVTLEDPRNFWEQLEKTAPELLILDIEMPYLKGLELCQVVRNDPRWSDLPIVFLTVHQDSDIIDQVFSLGADDFINKPIVGSALVTRIINRLERLKLRRRIAKQDRTKAQLIQQAETNLQTRLQQQAAVVRLGHLALQPNNLSLLTSEIVRAIADNLQVKYSQILQPMPNSKEMLFQAGVGWQQELAGQTLSLEDNSPIDYVFKTNRPQSIEDLSQENRFQADLFLQTHAIVSALIVPIAKQEECYGILAAYSEQRRKFDREDLHFLQAIANLLSGAIASQKQADLLKNTKEDLEFRLAEQTIELIKVNEQLQLELKQSQQIQAELELFQGRFAGIFNTAEDAIISVDSQQCITLFNQGAEKIFGYAANDILGKPLDLLIPVSAIEAHRQHVANFSNTQQHAKLMGERGEICGRRRDGEEFPAEASISKIKLGEETIFTVILRDISDRKEMERMKDEFISIVSHEIRTPLTSIYGALVMLKSGLLNNESQQQRMLKIATESTDRLVRLINDILDIERIALGKVKMQKKVCYLADLIDEAVNIVQILAEQAHISLSITCSELQLRVDPDRIIQTLTNLLSNAIKFSPANSTICVRAEVIDDQVLLQVEDRGRGIPENKLNTIFERFQQIDSSDSRDRDGTGLGLAICRSIIHQHGGRIWVESVLGQGSSFYFTLPLLGAEEQRG